jgi:asparagine synthase (glutamine-hydrolysing)
MPGIAGIISSDAPEKCRRRVSAMVETMQHEDFYKSRMHFEPKMGIYCGSTALEDSFAKNQVYFNEGKNIALVFSGECFLDYEIGTNLRANGHEIGEEKASWLPHIYEEQGQNFFQNLNGLFCGLLIDRRARKAFLFNDRYGIERIYFRESGGNFYFASEAKALLRIFPELREFDSKGVAQFLAFGCTLGCKTLFRGVELLPGGSLLTFENGNCRKGKYFSPEKWENQPQLSPKEFESKFQTVFKKILPRYFETSSKIGIALTGGLDTRMIMACQQKSERDLTCYTFSGENGETLDDQIAAQIAGASGLNHQLLRLGEDFFSNFLAHADRTIFVTDGCAGIFNAHEIYFNRLAREIAPVRLTGNYGSEILRGISTFKPLGLAPTLFNPDSRAAISNASQNFADEKKNPLTFAAFKEIPWNLFGNLAAGRSQLHFRTPYLDNELVALAYQIPESLRSASLPAMNLVNANNKILGAIPTDRGFSGDNSGLKFLYRRAFAEVTFKLDYYNSEGMPRLLAPFDPILKTISSRLGIFGLHKFLRYGNWFRGKLAPFVSERLEEISMRQNDFWDPHFLKNLAREHVSGQKNYSREISVVLALDAIERLLFRELPRDFDLPKIKTTRQMTEDNEVMA